MSVQKIEVVASAVKTTKQITNSLKQQPKQVINSYELQLGFVPQKYPMGHLKSNEQIERLIDMII